MLDIRIPMGAMFAILGPILIVYGLVSDPEIYNVHSLGINVNFWWGLVLTAFAVFLLAMAWRASGRARRAMGPNKEHG